MRLRNANLQARANLKKAAQEEVCTVFSLWCFVFALLDQWLFYVMSSKCGLRKINSFTFMHFRENCFLVAERNQQFADAIYSMFYFIYVFFFFFSAEIYYFSDKVLVEISVIPDIHAIYLYCLLLNNLQVVDLPLIVRTKAGMTSAAESITDSLRRTRQLMVQVGSQLAVHLLFPHYLRCLYHGCLMWFQFSNTELSGREKHFNT